MAADTTRTITFSNSPAKMVGLIALGVLMTALSAAVAFRWIGDPHPVFISIAYFGVVLFGLCIVVFAWRLISMRGPVVTVTPQGIRDIRLSPDLIPWSAVREVKTWQFGMQKTVVLAVDPAVESKLNLAPAMRWSRGANARLGADGLCVAGQGLATDYETLFRTCADYAAAARGKA